MTVQEIKEKITELAQKHAAIDEHDLSDIKDAEFLETWAENLIIAYCEENAYLINGFPTEKNLEELDEDYFCRERFHLYLDMLTCQHKDVAELTWHYSNSFWPETFEPLEDFIDQAKKRIDSNGFYDVTL
jgi:hypothetical protein